MRSAPMKFLLALFLPLMSTTSVSDGRALLYPHEKDSNGKQLDWVSEIQERISPLTQTLNRRWPLVLWRMIPSDEITRDVAEMLFDRGIVPTLPLDPSSIDAAKILQDVGAPVIVTAGGGVGTSWPYDLETDESLWAYEFDEPLTDSPKIPIPTRFTGWSIASAQIRDTLSTFRGEGLTVDAAWLDYEGLPFQSRYSDAVTSLNGADYLPPEALASSRSFGRYTRRLWISLLSTYIAAPIREIYPNASVTNWLAVLSLPEFPVPSWYGYALPMVGPTMFTATNPVAYGIDTAFNAGVKLNSMSTQRDVDRVYTEILLRQVSADSYAISEIAPELHSVVWIARWVRDQPNRMTPMMSRPAYREALRHLWLRGADAMHIFSPVRRGFKEVAIQEVEDAAAVFDEMLVFSELINTGQIIRFDYEINNQNPVLWSGLRKGNRAVVRVVSFNANITSVLIEPWPGDQITLDIPDGGATYILDRDVSHIVINKQTLP